MNERDCEVCGEEFAISTCVGCTQAIGPNCQSSENGQVCNECLERCKRDMDDSIERLVDRRVASALRLFADRLKSGTAPTYSLVLRGVADELDPPLPAKYIPFEDEAMSIPEMLVVLLDKTDYKHVLAMLLMGNGKKWAAVGDAVYQLKHDPTSLEKVCQKDELRKREAQCDT